MRLSPRLERSPAARLKPERVEVCSEALRVEGVLQLLRSEGLAAERRVALAGKRQPVAEALGWPLERC